MRGGGFAAARFLMFLGAALIVPGCAHRPVEVVDLQGPVECHCVATASDLAASTILTVEAFGEDGKALPGVLIRVDGPLWLRREPIQWRTDPSDPLEQPLRPGPWNVRASFRGLETYAASLNLPEGKRCTVRFLMQQESTLRFDTGDTAQPRAPNSET